jgi:hypothetical protein
MQAQITTTTGIATIKPKRKYTRRTPKIALVEPKAKKSLPKTARAYLNTLGMKADKESTAVTELVKLHSELVKKSSQKPAFTNDDNFVASQPKTKKSWWPWFGK